MGNILPGAVGKASSMEQLNKLELPGNSDEEIISAVKELIAKDQVVIFSKSYCPYCTTAKKAFQKLGKNYTVVELNKHDAGTEIQGVLKNITGSNTVPQVFVKGQCIGGGSDTDKLLKSGELAKMFA